MRPTRAEARVDSEPDRVIESEIAMMGSARTPMEMVARACPLCGSNDESSVFAKENFDPARCDRYAFASRKLPEYMHYRLIQCATCDLVYASPVPSTRALAKAYQEAAYDSKTESGFAARTYSALLRPIIEKLPDRAGAMDIGAGDGRFLKQLVQLGFTGVVGVEASEAPVAAAADAVRPLIRRALFSAGDFPHSSFSLVTCFQTIEHVDQPLELCRGVHRLLKPGGATLLVMHNRHAISARVLGLRSPIFDIEHLQLFSRRSGQLLLERAGFQDIASRTILNRYPLGYWLKLLPLPARIKSAALAVAARTRAARLPIILPAGNLSLLGFKRATSPERRFSTLRHEE